MENQLSELTLKAIEQVLQECPPIDWEDLNNRIEKEYHPSEQMDHEVKVARHCLFWADALHRRDNRKRLHGEPWSNAVLPLLEHLDQALEEAAKIDWEPGSARKLAIDRARRVQRDVGSVLHRPGVGEQEAGDYVTLDQMAAMVNRGKRTLVRLKNRKTNPLPRPDVEGGGGKPDEWLWATIRPWLQTEYAKILPERFPRFPAQRH
jgi:hypothetical protein